LGLAADRGRPGTRFHGDAAERPFRQLAHAQRSQVAAAYSRSARLEERRRMMAHWADYLDALRKGAANVVALRAR